MIILAVDPGTTHSGVVLYDADQHVVLIAEGAYPNTELLEVIRIGDGSLGDIAFDVFVIEDIQGMGLVVGGTTFTTAKWIGRLQEAYEAGTGRMAQFVGRGDEKIVLCGCNTYKDEKTGKRVGIKDTAIKTAIMDRFIPSGGGKTPVVGTSKQPGPLWVMHGQSHAWSALAVALTWVEIQKDTKG